MGLYYGRDAEAEYMVTSSDALRTSIFLDDSTLDIVWSQFVPWDVPTGERFSYFNPFLQQTVGEKNVLDIKENHSGSVMARWSTNLLGQEVALYYNRSRWQSPDGFNPQTQELFYPRLNTYGFSTRGELGKGILSLDASYYQSAQDKEGDKFWICNSEIRFILGYEFELATDLNVSFQWYQEQHQQQSQNLSSLAPGMEAAPREYNLLTMRLNQFLLSQKMTLSMFLYYSPTQKDSYFRLNMFHKFDDHWMKWLHPTHPIRVADNFINDNFGGNYLVYLTFLTKKQDNAVAAISQDINKVVDTVNQYIASNPPPVALDHNFFGLSFINTVWQQKMVSGMSDALIGSMIVVLIMMVLLFRSLTWGLVSMIPLSVTMAMIYGVIGLLGKDYDMPVAVLSALALGLSVDFAIHFITHAKEQVEQSGSWKAAMEGLFQEPAGAIYRNIVIIAVGFTPLLLAALVPYQTVGMLMASIMLVSGFATLLILPAVIKLAEPILFNTDKAVESTATVTQK
jgi:hypothetical protein